MKIERFEDIEGWKMARELTRAVYSATKNNAFHRDYGLRDQITRAAGSTMHNIAEGFDAGGDVEFIRFLRYAQRSCTEVQSELYVALDQTYVTDVEFQDLYNIAQRAKATIGGFIKYLSKTKDKELRTNDQ